MNRSHVYPIVVLSFLLDLIDDGLSLRHVARSSHDFDVSASYHDAIHLFQSQLRSFRYLVLHEGESFVLLRNWIPGHVDRFYGAEREEGLSYRIFFQFETDAPNVYPKPIIVKPTVWYFQILADRSLCDCLRWMFVIYY